MNCLFKTDSQLVRTVIIKGSELLTEIGERLNKEMRAVKNWRNLAYRLKIPHEEYDSFDTSKGAAKSPTKLLLEWLKRWKPDLTVKDLLDGLKQIDRYDVVDLVQQEVATGKLSYFIYSSRFYCYSLSSLHTHYHITVN